MGFEDSISKRSGQGLLSSFKTVNHLEGFDGIPATESKAMAVKNATDFLLNSNLIEAWRPFYSIF